MDVGLENPGPPATRIRPEGVSQAVVESLEHALSTVDTSDEEPLVRTMTGRHVVRRVGETEQWSVSSSTRLDPFDEASMHSTARCHSHPHNFSAEVDIDDESVPSKIAPSIPTWVDRDDCVESNSVSYLGGSERCSSDPIGQSSS